MEIDEGPARYGCLFSVDLGVGEVSGKIHRLQELCRLSVSQPELLITLVMASRCLFD
jgi:hypothetical protein